MQQGSILPFLQKPESSRPENSRPGQPYDPRSNSNSNSKHNATGHRKRPNRHRNMDLKKIADETKAELPKILSAIPGFDATESSVHNLKYLYPLSRTDCPDFDLPYGDENAGTKGTRIRVYDMDTFDAALKLDPNYKVYTHLGTKRPMVSTTSSSDTPADDDFMGRKIEKDHVLKSDFGQQETSLGIKVKTGHEDSDTIMKDAEDDAEKGENSNAKMGDGRRSNRESTAQVKTDDNTQTKPEQNTTAEPVVVKSISGPFTTQKDGPNEPPKPDTKHDTIVPSPATQRAPKPVVVLNLASERSPGGGWQNGALAQEECLCYRSSLYLSLHKSYYTLPSLSAIYTPNVVLIRDAMSRGHTLLTPLEQPANLPVTSVISVAALRRPQLTDDKKHFKNEGQRAETKRKIRVTLRVAAHKGHTKLVLGAMGCGVFSNPPKEVAECFLEVLREKEFQGGWWEEVAFAVLDNVKEPDGGKDGKGNFGVFYRVLDGQIV